MSDSYDPTDCSPPGSSVHGILQARYWSGLPFPSPGDLPDPGIKPRSPALQADTLTSEPPGKPKGSGVNGNNPLLCCCSCETETWVHSSELLEEGWTKTRSPGPSWGAGWDTVPSRPQSTRLWMGQVAKGLEFQLQSVIPMNIQDWFPLGLTGWISLQFKWLSRVFSKTTV